MSDETDWFGYPLERRRGEPVSCPRCGQPFDQSVELRAHLSRVHDLSTPARPTRRRTRPQSPLGRDPRSPTAQRLMAIPLWLVLMVNVVAALLFVGAIDYVEPPWWPHVRAQSWSPLLIVPLLWPTIAFLGLRGVD